MGTTFTKNKIPGVKDREKIAVKDSPAADQYTDNIIDKCAADREPLPLGLHDDIVAIIEGYCNSHDINDCRKIHPIEWQAVCICIGQSIKQRKLLNDDTMKAGRHYDANKVTALLSLYGYICAEYKQIAFSHNFPRFAGVSREYLHDYMKQGLSSSRVNLAQKAAELQKASLVGAVAGGGSATVGNIFLSKALAGLQETSTVVHVSSAPAPIMETVPDLARLGDGSGK